MSARPQAEIATDQSLNVGDLALPGARSQALFRALNEEIRRIAGSFTLAEDLELVCECERQDCFARVTVSLDDYEAVRKFPTRFLTKPDHVAAAERIVHETALYVVVEKVGPGAQTAISLDPRKQWARELTA